MTEVHTCSYSCQRIECIRAQRDELAARLTAAQQQEQAAPPSAPVGVEAKTLPVPTRVHLIGETAVIVGTPERGWDEDAQDAHNCDAMGCATIGPHVLARVPFTDERALAATQKQGQAVAWQDEWRAAVAAKLSGYGLSEEASAVFAESELGEYRAGLCDCAENDPADMVDLMMGVALDAIEKWKAESAGRPFGYKRTALPSAPVGVEGLARLLERIRDLLASLPVDCLGSGTDASGQPYPIRDEVIHGITKALAQQPAAVDEAMVERAWVAFCEDTGPARAAMRAALAAALAAQQGGAK